MGMSIDKHIEVLNSYNHGFTGYAGNLQDSIDVAMNTMRKYQKIEQVLKSLDDGEINYPQMTYYLREVLEDGND